MKIEAWNSRRLVYFLLGIAHKIRNLMAVSRDWEYMAVNVSH